MLYLLAQTLGLLTAVVVVAGLAGGRGRSPLAAAAVAALVAVVCAATVAQVPPSVKELNQHRKEKFDVQALRGGCHGQQRNTAVDFFSWARARLPKGVRYYYVQGPGLGPDDYACVGLGLLPAIRSPKLQGAQYVVFAGGVPRDWRERLDRARRPLTQFAPDYAIARIS